MKTCFFVVLFIVVVYGDYKISAPDNLIKDLTTASQQQLKEDLKNAINASQVSQLAFNSANETCQKSLISLIDNCRVCVRYQCWMRVTELQCKDTADFNKTFDKGLTKLGDKIDHFFRNTIPRFFTEDLKKFFGHNVPYFFENDFKDFFKHKLPDFFKNDVSHFFITDIPNFFKGDVSNFFKNDFTNFFQKDVKNFFEVDVKNAFKDAWSNVKGFFNGRRRREITAEPTSCENFDGEDNVQKSCSYYLKNCSQCLPDLKEREKACPDLAKAHNNMKQFGWIINAATANGSVFEIKSISNGDEEPKDGVFKNPVIELVIFGQNSTIKMNEPIRSKDKEDAAKLIVKNAIEYYKSQMKENSTTS